MNQNKQSERRIGVGSESNLTEGKGGSELEGEFNDLHNSTEILKNVIKVLNGHLAPVLRDAELQEESSKDESAPQSIICKEVRDIKEEVDFATNRIHEIISRLTI